MNRMMSVTLAAGMLFLPASAIADGTDEQPRAASALPFPVEPIALQQRCWLDHAQVQPVPVRMGTAAGNLAEGGPKAWKQPGSQPGSEHWNVADLRRACESPWTRGASFSTALDEFLDSR